MTYEDIKARLIYQIEGWGKLVTEQDLPVMGATAEIIKRLTDSGDFRWHTCDVCKCRPYLEIVYGI